MAALWRDNGYEVYTELRAPFNRAMDDVIGMPARPYVDLKALQESVRNKGFELLHWLEGRNACRAQIEGAMAFFTGYVRNQLVGMEAFSLEEWWGERRYLYLEE